MFIHWRGVSRRNAAYNPLPMRVAMSGAMLFVLTSAAQADTIWLRSGSGKALPLPNIRVQKVEGGTLSYVSESSGNESRKPLESVSRIKLDDEVPFSAAEEAYDGGDFKSSIDGYRKAISASARPWVKVRSATRLFEAGTKAGDFPAAVTGYAGLAGLDADAASKISLTVPPGTSSDALAQATKQVKAATAGTLQPAQKDLLLNLLVRIQTANKDTAGAAESMKALGKSEDATAAAATPAPGDAAPASGGGNRVKADVKLTEARLAVANKHYKEAMDAITGSSTLLTEPDQQDEALFILAESKAALAGSDPSALADAAIAYMRVVANFKNLAGAPHVADSLLKAGQIEEKLGKPVEASKAYEDVAEQFKGSAAAKTAAESAARLKAK